MKAKISILILFSLLSCFVKAQNNTTKSAEEIVGEVLALLSEESEEELDYSMYYEDLMSLSENPINLNKTEQNELKTLFFLSDLQIENILFYLYRYEKMHTIYELRLVEGLGEREIRCMLPFVRVGDAKEKTEPFSLKNSLKYGKNSFFFFLKSGLEKPKGYRPLSEFDVETKKDLYLGNQFYNSLRYRFQSKNRLLFGFTAEKDPGELFFRGRKAYDFLSGYIQMNNIAGFKNINIGDFRVNFGEGLVLRTNMMMGKSAQVLNRSQAKAGINHYGSTDEYKFFRGVAATYKIAKLDLTAFYSNKMIDADTAGGEIASIYKTGLHRTRTELRKRHTVNQQVFGANISLTKYHYQVGVTFVHTELDHRLSPKPTVYNALSFRGTSQSTAGVHYRLRWQKINAFGETAISKNRALATINGFSFKPISTLGFLLLYRNISPRFDNFYTGSFTATAECRNEEGIYIGLELMPIKKWKLAAYADSYRFPWLKYNTSSPSSGGDYLINVEYNPNYYTGMYWRVNLKEKEINQKLPTKNMMQLSKLQKLNFRYGLLYNYGAFRFQTIINANTVKKGNLDRSYGISALQDLSYSFSKLPLRIDLRYQFFDAEDYENRIFSYEKDVLYAFSIPMNYGKGSRYYLNLKYDIFKNISLWLKLSQTAYADNRRVTGAGKDEINGNRKTNIHLLARWNFRYGKQIYKRK